MAQELAPQDKFGEQLHVGDRVDYAGDSYRVGELGLFLLHTTLEDDEVRSLIPWDDVIAEAVVKVEDAEES